MTKPEDATPPPGDPAPIAVKGTTTAVVQASLVSLALAVATLIGAMGTILSFIKTRDLAGWIVWLQSSDAAMVITAVMTLGGFLTIMIRSAQRKWREIFFARNAPNSVAYIIGEQLPPSPDSRARNGNGAPQTRLVSIMQGDVKNDPEGLIASYFDTIDEQKAVATSAQVMRAGGVDPDAPFTPGPFPSEMRRTEEDLRHPGKLSPDIPFDALTPPVIDLRNPQKDD